MELTLNRKSVCKLPGVKDLRDDYCPPPNPLNRNNVKGFQEDDEAILEVQTTCNEVDGSAEGSVSGQGDPLKHPRTPPWSVMVNFCQQRT